MLDHQRFTELQRLIQKLMRPGFRRSSGLAWVEGSRGFIRAVDHRRRIQTIVLCERLLKPAVVQMMVRRLRRTGTDVVRVTPEQFRLLSRTPRASGIGVLLRQHWTPLDQLRAEAESCWIAVSRIRSPGNLGTIIRTAEAVGLAGVIFLDSQTDPFDPGVMRGSMGSVISMRLTRTTLASLVDWARRHDVALLGTSPRGCELFTTALPQRSVVLLGEEREGLTRAELDACATTVRIPMADGSDSINVAVAAGVVLFELRRRSAAQQPPISTGG